VVIQMRSRLGYLLGLAGTVAVVVYFVAGNERLQRFTSLEDTEYVVDRIGGSVNLGLIDLVFDYPVGAGLGSAFGTSIPSFLQPLAPTPIGVESERGRIALEQSLVGAGLWLGFVGWFFTRRRPSIAPAWALTVRLMWLYILMSWATALIGC